MSEKQSRKEIKGIDPKSYGDFDKFMDKAKRVSRYVLPGVAVALTASCTPEMINAIITTPTPELSPLPSDFTKTLAPLSTEANYELTPTVTNPATQELTLVSPTEVATEMPTLTLTLEPTATMIPTEIATAIPEPTATKTFEPTATREFSVEEEANMETVAARMADYLNSTGDFTYEKVREKMYKQDWIPDKNYWQNGIYLPDNNLTEVIITGFNLGLINLEDRQIIIFGTQDVEARRIVVPVQYMPEGYNNDLVTTGIFIGSSDSISGTQSLIKSKAQFEKIMLEGTGKAFGVKLAMISEDERARIGNYVIPTDKIDYAKKKDLGLPANFNMIYSVWRSTSYGAQEGYPWYKINELIDSTGGSQTLELTIETLADLKNLGEVLDKLPLTSSLATATK